MFAQIHAGIRYFDQDGVPPSTPTRTDNTNDPRVPRTCSPDGTEVGPVSYWSGLINGLGRHRNVSYTNKTRLSTFTVEPNKRYRFRLIGAQSLFAYMFSIDEHDLQLIATDGHFVKPETVQFITIHSGERYDFIINTMTMASKKNFIIRAETLEVNMSSPSVCGNSTLWPGELFSLFPDHSAEAILHYDSTSDIPSNNMYQQIVDSAIPMRGQCAAMNRNCTAVNCPFEQFPSLYGIECKHIHQLDLLNEVNSDQLPDFNTENTLFFNFGFEGDGSTSAINGINFAFPPAPLQLNNNIPNRCNPSNFQKCDNNSRLVTPDCLCTHVYDIDNGASYRFVFTAVGPNRTDNTNWNFAHPIHLHGHSFHVAKIGCGSYTDTGRIMNASEDITCKDNDYICTKPDWSSENPNLGRTDINKAPLKDTVLIPAGGYAIVYFKANNPGYWFLHCHIEVHQLEGMAVVINEANEMHNEPPPNMPQCGEFTWEPEEFRLKESSPSPFQPIQTMTPIPQTNEGLYFGFMLTFVVLFAVLLLVLIIYAIVTCCAVKCCDEFEDKEKWGANWLYLIEYLINKCRN